MVSVTIDHCTLRGSRAAVERARRELPNSRWPSVADQQVVILRQLETRGSSAHWSRSLYLQADRLIADRVSGWSDAAIDADCVWFGSDAELLARLSWDLASGRAAQLWFWQSFRRYFPAPFSPPGTALLRLWQDQSALLPVACALLGRQRRLALVWRQLHQSQAATLLSSLLPSTQIDALRQPLLPAEAALRVDPQQATGLREAIAAFGVSTVVSGDNATPNWRQLLAMVLMLAVERPHWLASGDAPAQLRLLLSTPGDTGRRPNGPSLVTDPAASLRPAQRAGHRAGSPLDDQQSRDAAEPSVLPGRTTQGHLPEPPSPAASLSPPAEPPLSRHPPRPDGTDDELATAEAGEPLATAPPDYEVTLPQWRVEQGGLFYLLNLLNQPLLRDRLLADPRALAFPSGWGWLYRIGEALGLEPEPALLRCLGELAGLPEGEFPASLPLLDQAAGIVAYGEQRYQRYGVWQPSLLRCPADIRYRRPELDIHYSMADLDTQVRMAALDIDPGWIDWLGCRVRFHYQDSG